MPIAAYVIFAILAFVSFVFGAIWESRRIDSMKTFGDIYVSGKDLYLAADPELRKQPNGRYIILRVIQVEAIKDNKSREKQGL